MISSRIFTGSHLDLQSIRKLVLPIPCNTGLASQGMNHEIIFIKKVFWSLGQDITTQNYINKYSFSTRLPVSGAGTWVTFIFEHRSLATGMADVQCLPSRIPLKESLRVLCKWNVRNWTPLIISSYNQQCPDYTNMHNLLFSHSSPYITQWEPRFHLFFYWFFEVFIYGCVGSFVAAACFLAAVSGGWFLLRSIGSGARRLQQLWHTGLVAPPQPV